MDDDDVEFVEIEKTASLEVAGIERPDPVTRILRERGDVIVDRVRRALLVVGQEED